MTRLQDSFSYHFKFKWTVLIALSLLIQTMSYAVDREKAGRVISVVGKVKAVSADKTERELKRADHFYVSDQIVVDESSNTQLKFTDGGIINLIASSEYKIDSYIYNDPKKKSESLSTLTKGGFKALSGGVAKENPTGTLLRTPVATIGLRGTLFLGVLKGDEFSVGCIKGSITVKNQQGEVEVGPESPDLKEYATVKEGEPPMATAEQPIDLAQTSFDVEGGLTFEQAEADQAQDELAEAEASEEAQQNEEEIVEESEGSEEGEAVDSEESIDEESEGSEEGEAVDSEESIDEESEGSEEGETVDSEESIDEGAAEETGSEFDSEVEDTSEYGAEDTGSMDSSADGSMENSGEEGYGE